jgi:hypothetical protein
LIAIPFQCYQISVSQPPPVSFRHNFCIYLAFLAPLYHFLDHHVRSRHCHDYFHYISQRLHSVRCINARQIVSLRRLPLLPSTCCPLIAFSFLPALSLIFAASSCARPCLSLWISLTAFCQDFAFCHRKSRILCAIACLDVLMSGYVDVFTIVHYRKLSSGTMLRSAPQGCVTKGLVLRDVVFNRLARRRVYLDQTRTKKPLCNVIDYEGVLCTRA